MGMDQQYKDFRSVVRKEFSARLKRLRMAKGCTQKRLAAMLRVDRSAYACYEIGKSQPDLSGLLVLANFYGISLDELLGKDEPVIAEEISKLDNLE